MSPSRFAREAQLAVVAGNTQHRVRDRADAWLAAIESLQQARDSAELCQRAALAVISVTAAAAVAVVYFEVTGGTPQLASSGALDQAAADACAVMLRDLVAAGASSPYLLLAHGASLAAPFSADRVRGAILLERSSGTFAEGDGRAVAQFGRQVAAAASAVALRERARRVERIEAAVLDALCEGVLVAVDGRVKLFNRAAAQMFSADREATLGSAVAVTWPELARLLESGAQLDGEPLRIGGKDLLVTLRSIRDGRPPSAAVVSFTERKTGEGRVRRPAAQALHGFEDLIGESPSLASVRQLAQVAAQSGSSLIIEGESGVGKEVLAQAIHTGGPRGASPFVAVHCAAIPRDLLESELFGYEAFAFTGANPHGHAGKFELAQGGTLLLDDVVELPLDMQAKLLRVLQERSVTRLGGSRSRPIDVRIVATSNVPLRDAVESGRFRSDLFYRLSVLSIALPPLRDRREDIRPLAERFLTKYAKVHGRRLRSVGAEALRALESYSWPGNVRELEHWIESEIHFASPHAVCLERLTRLPTALDPLHAAPPVRPVREAEKEMYATALTAASGSISRAARALGVSRGKLYRKIRLYGLLQR
jgi:sigma-54 dependent transcriptional regulator, acetoin dehydrogenase operon transcriptional activator AcoR